MPATCRPLPFVLLLSAAIVAATSAAGRAQNYIAYPQDTATGPAAIHVDRHGHELHLPTTGSTSRTPSAGTCISAWPAAASSRLRAPRMFRVLMSSANARSLRRN